MIAGMTLSGGGIVLKQLDPLVIASGPRLDGHRRRHHASGGPASGRRSLATAEDDPLALRVKLLEAGDGDTPAEAAIAGPWSGGGGYITSDARLGRLWCRVTNVRDVPFRGIVLRLLLSLFAYVAKRSHRPGHDVLVDSDFSVAVRHDLLDLDASRGERRTTWTHCFIEAFMPPKRMVRCPSPRGSWLERFGFDSRMTGWDRFITAITLLWPVGFTLIFIGVTVYAYRYGLDAEWWLGVLALVDVVRLRGRRDRHDLVRHRRRPRPATHVPTTRGLCP